MQSCQKPHVAVAASQYVPTTYTIEIALQGTEQLQSIPVRLRHEGSRASLENYEGIWGFKWEPGKEKTVARMLAEEVLGVQDIIDVQVALVRQLGDLG